MKVISLNVGRPQPYTYHGRTGYTSIFKSPVAGERQVSAVNITGDEQADLAVHGGIAKAVYAYDISYYDHRKNLLQRQDWGFGLFGENLTTENLADDTIRVGNVYQIGTVWLRAIQPRFPCFKLNIRFGRDTMLQQFTKEGKNGTYFSVLKPGRLQAGDRVRLVEQSPYNVTIQDMVNVYYSKGKDKLMLAEILTVPYLPEQLQRAFRSFNH